MRPASRRNQRGAATGPKPVDRGQAGTKHHLTTEGQGLPLAIPGDTLKAAVLVPQADHRAYDSNLVHHPGRQREQLADVEPGHI